MSVYNSEIYLRNDGYEEIIIGTLLIPVGETVKIWDTKNANVSQLVWDNFYQVRDNHDGYDVYSLLTSGGLVVIHDGLDMHPSMSPNFLSNTYREYESFTSVTQMMSTGVKLSETKDDRGHIIFVPENRIGDESDIASHNFSDKTTWFSESVRADYSDLTDSGDGFTWNLSHENIIDLVHGKVHNEDIFREEADHKYELKVRVDGYELTEFCVYDDYENDGYDYIADYKVGTITFLEDQSGKDVEASYSYADGSAWTLKPETGKILIVEDSEVQFSENIEFTDAIDLEIRAYNPDDLPNKMTFFKRSYKSFHNFVDEARGCYPEIPPIGGDSELGTKHKIIGFPFSYRTIRELEDSSGLEIKMKTRNNRELGGERTTVTFYCTVKDEE